MMVVVQWVSGMELKQIVQVRTRSLTCDMITSACMCTAVCHSLTLTNGMISYSPDTTPRLEGTVATHSCDVGYRLSVEISRTCQSDRTWSGGTIVCEGILMLMMIFVLFTTDTCNAIQLTLNVLVLQVLLFYVFSNKSSFQLLCASCC